MKKFVIPAVFLSEMTNKAIFHAFVRGSVNRWKRLIVLNASISISHGTKIFLMDARLWDLRADTCLHGRFIKPLV
ncbi:hypothetical protein M1M87_00855 [Thermodesulfovibrionales bacterium]|nr:hypothetical protein [Thermodesulfovibrionales bacterium]MCL0107094.1 hypothetical protein [Thermodesulfovibrionales bacterium]